VSMWAVRRGAKKLLVANFTAGGAMVHSLGSAPSPSCGVSLSALDFLEAVRLLCLSCLATSLQDILQLVKRHCICPIQCTEQSLAAQSLTVALALSSAELTMAAHSPLSPIDEGPQCHTAL
jgi:hypothetical protein